MQFASGKVQLSLCHKGCGRLDIGQTSLYLSNADVCDLLSIARNTILSIENSATEAKEEKNPTVPRPPLHIIR
jgi:hypothetical protein